MMSVSSASLIDAELFMVLFLYFAEIFLFFFFGFLIIDYLLQMDFLPKNPL